MNSNLDLGGLPLRESNSEQPQQQPEQDPVEQFDLTRKARQASLKTVEEVLLRVAEGQVKKKELVKAIRALHEYSKGSDRMITGLINDLFRVVRAVAQSEVNLFALRTNLKAVVQALSQKEIVTEDELRKIHDEKVLPEELPPSVTEEQIAELKQKDLEKIDGEMAKQEGAV